MSEETRTGNEAVTVPADANGSGAAPAAAAPAQQPAAARTFTQAELDAIVNERLGRERQKYADYNTVKGELAALKQQNAVRDIREAVGKDKKVPWELLTGDTKEDCEKQADAILAFARGQNAAPAVPDGGEARVTGASTREQFAAFMDAAFGK